MWTPGSAGASGDVVVHIPSPLAAVVIQAASDLPDDKTEFEELTEVNLLTFSTTLSSLNRLYKLLKDTGIFSTTFEDFQSY